MEDKSLLVEGTWWKYKKTGETGFITDVQKKKGLIIFRFSQSGHVGSFTNMEFLREFENLASHPYDVPVKVDSIWKSNKTGDIVKVLIESNDCNHCVHYINLNDTTGPLVMSHVDKAAFVTEHTFLRNNDNGALYRHNKNPNKYLKVIETTEKVLMGAWMRFVKYRSIEGDSVEENDGCLIVTFHSNCHLLSIDPEKEYTVPTDSVKTIEVEDKEMDKIKSKYHKIAKELRDLAKECDITVGSIWREARGCAKEDVGRLVKVTAISDSGNIIDWVRLDVKPKDMDVLGVETHGSTCKSSFLYCFERPERHITAPSQVAWPGTIWYHTNGGIHIAITIKEENGTVWFVSSDNKVLDLYWQMAFKEWIETYKLYNGVDKPPCFPEGSFDEMLEETKGRYERVMERLKEEEKMEANKTETYLKTDTSKLKDFGTGAKREDKTGKGRYDLIPGDVMSEFEDFAWETYFKYGSTTCSATDVSKSAYFDDWTDVELYYDFIVNVISYFFAKDHIECTDDCGEISYEVDWDIFRSGLYDMRKQLALHYEAGAVVHGIDNWKKGLPVYGSERGGCFLDSMRRHIDQALQGKDDEPHAVAALWNAFCAVWTLKHRPHSAMYQNASAVKAEEAPDKIADTPTMMTYKE